MKNLDAYCLFRGAKIFFNDTGRGRAIVFIHGFLGSKEIWKDLADELAKKYRVICIDLPGHGKSSNIGYIHSMELMAKAVKAVLNHLKLKKYILIGHSMGGYVSLAFAELYPDNLKGICLFHSTSFADSEEKKSDRRRAISLVKSNARVYTKNTISNLFAPSNQINLKNELNFAQKIALRTNKRGVINALEGMKERANRDVILHFSNFPIMMIMGKQDATWDFLKIKKFASNI